MPLSRQQRQRLVRVAQGLEPADLALTGGTLVCPHTRETFQADLLIAEGHVAAFGQGFALETHEVHGAYISPGFTDGHIHIESSMLTPKRFAEAVIPHGTTTVVAEPHEIVNVLGLQGMEFMLEDGQSSGLNFFMSVPSCVPASPFEQGGAHIGPNEIARALGFHNVLGLAEMMNYPGILNLDPEVWDILDCAGRAYRMDGHAAGLSGRSLMAYVCAGFHSDHEATTADEALERLRLGLWLMVREGSAAKNLSDLIPVLRAQPRRAMIVSDDVEVLELLEFGHLDRSLRKAVAYGLDPLYALSLVTCNPAEYWGLHDLGFLGPGARADMVVLEDLQHFKVLKTFVGGRCLYEHTALKLPEPHVHPKDTFPKTVHLGPDWSLAQFDIDPQWPILEALPDQITTRKLSPELHATDLNILVVAERHNPERTEYSSAWVRGMGLTQGALGSTVLHDSHNLILVGTDAEDLRLCGQTIAEMGGGVAFVSEGKILARIPLTLAGLMGTESAEKVAQQQKELEHHLRERGCALPHPLTTLSFLGLTVIPSLKLTPKGLFDVDALTWIPTSRQPG